MGRAVSLDIERVPVDKENQRPLLEVKNLTAQNAEGREVIRQMSFTLNTGEILGVAGMRAAGKRSCASSLRGCIRHSPAR